MISNMLHRAFGLTTALALCLTILLATGTTASAQSCVQFNAAQVTHGFQVTNAFPNGDQFLLNSPIQFTVTTPGAQGVSKLTAGQFGSNPGYLAGTSPEGVTASTAGSTTRVISCQDSWWDLNFYVATKGSTEGDMVNLFLIKPDGSQQINLAMFTITGGVLKLNSHTSDVSVHLDDRFARGSQALTTTYISTAAFPDAAGDAGSRTKLLTIAFSMLPNAATMGCWQLGFDIKRGAGAGSTSVLIADTVVNRNEVSGDRNRNQAGLLGGLTGGYPTGAKCAAACPACPLNITKCSNICFMSAEHFRLKYDCLIDNGFLGDAEIFIPGMNFNNPINVQSGIAGLRLALRGNNPFGGRPVGAWNLFVQQYVTAQLSLYTSVDGPAITDALWGNLACYGFPSGVLPITLSNGVTLDGNSMLKDLFMQLRVATLTYLSTGSNTADIVALGQALEKIQGHAQTRACNQFSIQ